MSNPPRKSLGQHWLGNELVLNKIILAANIESNDRILEIGPGKGALTDKLLQTNVELVHAIEIDRRLIQNLRNRFSSNHRFSLMEANVLSIPLTPLDGIPANKVVANIPYNITGPILQRLLGRLGTRLDHTFTKLVLLLQKEVADRILASPGDSNFSALSVRIQLLGKCSEVCDVPSSSFNPPPKVDSKVITIDPLSPSDRLTTRIESKIEQMLKIAFLERRKKLRNTLLRLCSPIVLEELANNIGISLDQRPQELSTMNWIDLAKGIQSLEELQTK